MVVVVVVSAAVVVAAVAAVGLGVVVVAAYFYAVAGCKGCLVLDVGSRLRLRSDFVFKFLCPTGVVFVRGPAQVPSLLMGDRQPLESPGRNSRTLL